MGETWVCNFIASSSETSTSIQEAWDLTDESYLGSSVAFS